MMKKLHSCLSLATRRPNFNLVYILFVLFIWSQVNPKGYVTAFHLNFGHRLLRSAQHHQLNPTSTLIRPIECRNANNHTEVGICMFSIDCMQNKGVPLSVCKHNYFVGTCCRLPDYNNFVGIVYDLRETETNQILEARRVTGSTQAAQDSPPTSRLAISSNQSAATEAATWSTSSPVSSASSSTELPAPNDAKLDSKYMISATSLFASSSTPAVSKQTDNGETARNANGPLQPISVAEKNQAQLLVASELDSFQIQTALANNDARASTESVLGSKLGQQQHYELIKDESGDVFSTVSSAHSKPVSSASSLAHAQAQQDSQPQLVNNQTQGSLGSAASVTTSSPDEAAFATRTSQRPQVVVLSNNHQQASRPSPGALENTTSSDANLPKLSTTSSPASDQDFTLASVSENSKAQPVGSTLILETLASDGLSQTTTPFTTSLSTALLPNVSSHPYSPTTVASNLISGLEPLASTATSGNFSQAPTTSQVSTSSSSNNQLVSNLSQFYSPSADVAERPATLSSARPILGTLPLNSMAKIVSSSATGAAVNQLMPGFSGLQSAILSHIPFKIASGLSSGLSSYLQAAMKPSGSRPLIASNNAPAAQYQHHSTSTTRAPSTNGTTMSGSVRFPGTSADANSPQPSTGSPNASATSGDIIRDAQLVCGRPQASNMVATDSKRRVARIVGGNQSLFGQWPWMVSLRQWRKGAFLHKCGAALLNENWAITAAHCVENVKPADLLLRLGEFDVSSQDEPFPYSERRVKTVVSHPSFDPKTFEYDLALLKFAEPIKYERNILPVCVPTGNDSYVDRIATVIGWGRLYEDGPLPDVIQHVDVPIITNIECEKMYKNAGYIEEIPNMFICAGISKGGRDSCEGDSGGPLTMVDTDGRSYLVGIISWGIGCALPSQPGVYTRITAFSGWINQITAF